VLKAIEAVWGGGETMAGGSAGFGFLLLYALLQGSLRVKCVNTGYGGYGGGMMGGYMGGGYGAQLPCHSPRPD